MNGSAYGSTSGTEEREAREMMERLLVFSLADEIRALREEEPWQARDRNSRTLAKEVDFRVVLSALRDGATLHEEDGDARASLHLIDGHAALTVGSDEAELEANDVAMVDAGHRWVLRANGDCAVLLTLAWPREKAGV
ncbi:MAG: hypothetical protein M3N29_10710 [Chloroflexota bacterium]|nr:hypothetical protein [Chloroflexota bacterium]